MYNFFFLGGLGDDDGLGFVRVDVLGFVKVN
jgi:hypothetical protein